MALFNKKQKQSNIFGISEISEYVGISQLNDKIVIAARPIDENSKYIIEFNYHDELADVIKMHKHKIFEGTWADLGEDIVSPNGKPCVYITFDFERVKAGKTPKIKIVLMSKYKDLAMNIYRQLNAQALEMQKKSNQDIFGR